MRAALILLCLNAGICLYSQGFRSRIYLPGSIDHRSQAIFPVTGNKYIATGFSTDVMHGKQVSRLTVMGLDSAGQLEWVKKYGDTSLFYFTNIFITRAFIMHSGYIYYAGCVRDSTNKQIGVLTKIDLHGDTVWQRIFRDPDPLEDVIPQMVTAGVDGGFLITGFFQHWGQHYSKCLLIKTDSQGKELWRKKIGKLPPDVQDGKSIIQDSSTKKIVITGYMYGPSYLAYDNILVLDSQGNKLQQAGFHEGLATDLLQTRNQQFVSAGYQIGSSQYGDFERAMLLSFDIENPLPAKWKRTWSIVDYNSAYNVIKELPNSNFILAQSRDSANANPIMTFVRTDTSGIAFWERSYDYKMSVGVLDFSLTNDGGWIAALAVTSNKPVNPFFFVKYDSTGCDSTLAYCALVSALSENVLPGATVFPIPCNEALHIRNTTGRLTALLYDATGRLQKNIVLEQEGVSASIHTGDLPEGVYLLRLMSQNGALTKRIIINH